MSSDLSSVLVALDIDRTIFNTTRFVERVYEESALLAGEQSILDRIKSEERSARGENYDLLTRLDVEQLLPQVEVVYSHADDLLYDGVRELLSNITSSNVTYILLTYGSPLAQTYKLKLIEHILGFPSPFHITSEPNKSAWLKTVHENGLFMIPVDNNGDMQATTVILVDDKASNLSVTHDHLHTILIDNSVDQSSVATGIPIRDVWNQIDSLLAHRLH